MANMPEINSDAATTEARRRQIIRSRTRVTALVLVGFVLLFFAITIVKMKI